MNIMVTGCFSFMAWNFTKMALKAGHLVDGVDCLKYPSKLPYDNYIKNIKKSSLADFKFHERPISMVGSPMIDALDIDVIVNFAAESHVTNSIESSSPFIETNIAEFTHLLDSIKGAARSPNIIQVSTDEVYGDISDGEFDELAALNPSNPYAASKASADLILMSYARTHDLEYNIIRPTNNFGKFQYYEKLIPTFINNVLNGKKTSLHDNGDPVRTWTHNSDTSRAILTIMEHGDENTTYNCSSGYECTNMWMCNHVLDMINIRMEELDLDLFDTSSHSLYTFGEVRKGQDIRYALNSDKLRSIEWEPTTEENLDKYLYDLVKSYIKLERK
jgi:dTDP-glucose 4,6-dehydratase